MDDEQVEKAPVERPHWLDNSANLKRLIRWFCIFCGAVFLSDLVFFFHHKHLSFEEGEFSIEGWFSFYAVFGFVAYGLLVVISKQLRKVLMRGEDYYDR